MNVLYRYLLVLDHIISAITHINSHQHQVRKCNKTQQTLTNGVLSAASGDGGRGAVEYM